MNRYRARQSCTATIIMLGAISPVLAQNFDTRIDNGAVSVTPLDQPIPLFPGRGIRPGQEGWVAVNFVITPDGNAIDPIILDSSGGREFEESTREIISKWRFEAPGELRERQSPCSSASQAASRSSRVCRTKPSRWSVCLRQQSLWSPQPPCSTPATPKKVSRSGAMFQHVGRSLLPP